MENKTYDELFKPNWLGHICMLGAGAILMFINWGVKDLRIHEFYNIWTILAFLVGSYFLGFLVAVLLVLIRDGFKVHQAIFVIPIAIFIFYAFFLNEYISAEHNAANRYKKLIEKHLTDFSDEKKEDIEYDIEEIENDRHSWSEPKDYYDE